MKTLAFSLSRVYDDDDRRRAEGEGQEKREGKTRNGEFIRGSARNEDEDEDDTEKENTVRGWHSTPLRSIQLNSALTQHNIVSLEGLVTGLVIIYVWIAHIYSA